MENITIGRIRIDIDKIAELITFSLKKSKSIPYFFISQNYMTNIHPTLINKRDKAGKGGIKNSIERALFN